MLASRRLASITAGLGLLTSLGCSVVLDFPQCVEDVDCTNTQGVELVCRDGQCVEPIPPSTVACTADADCAAAFDDTVICGVGGVCAALTTARCELIVRPEGVDSSGLVYLGSILPRTGTYAVLGEPMHDAVQLAVEDFNSATTLAGGRKVAWVGCDSQGDPAEAAAAARELVAAGVTAIVGPGLSAETIDVANVTAAANALLMSPSASAQVLAQLNDQDLVWRTTGNDGTQAAGIAARIASLDPVPQRVFALVKNDLYGEGLIDGLSPRLADVLPTNGLGTALYSPIESFDTSEALLAEYGARVALAFDREPDVIVVLGSVEARELVLFYLEAWAGADPRPPLPRFIVSSEAVPMLEGIVEGVSDNFKPTLMASLEGVSHDALDPDNYEPFEVRYSIRFDRDAGINAGLAYDAAMMLLLAHGASSGPSGGAELAAALGRLADPAGVSITFDEGLGFIRTVLEALQAGDSVHLQGISGTLDFDLGSGDLPRDLTGWNVEAVSGTTRPILRARRHYDRAAGTWADL
ncbi:MAG: ABC transporter substrate-binding protein [Myxococcales bacterium]|nr:ABC transporter substrate-binding protein [Myxococcales bacterium]